MSEWAGRAVAEIPDDAIEAVARQLLADYDSEFDADHLSWQDFEGQARRILGLAAPLIAARVGAEAQKEHAMSFVSIPSTPDGWGVLREATMTEHRLIVSGAYAKCSCDVEFYYPDREAQYGAHRDERLMIAVAAAVRAEAVAAVRQQVIEQIGDMCTYRERDGSKLPHPHPAKHLGPCPYGQVVQVLLASSPATADAWSWGGVDTTPSDAARRRHSIIADLDAHLGRQLAKDIRAVVDAMNDSAASVADGTHPMLGGWLPAAILQKAVAKAAEVLLEAVNDQRRVMEAAHAMPTEQLADFARWYSLPKWRAAMETAGFIWDERNLVYRAWP